MSIQTLFDKMGIILTFDEPKTLSIVEVPVVSRPDPYVVRDRFVLCGEFLEHYHYNSPYIKGLPRIWHKKSSFVREKPQEQMLDNNVKRARSKIRRLVNSNSDLTCFLTLTYNRSMTDFVSSNAYFENFIKRLKRIYPQLKYLAVPEFQKNKDYYGNEKIGGGNIHYHLLCNYPLPNFENTLDLQKFERDFQYNIWQDGFVTFRQIDFVDNVGAYVCKYLGKQNFDKRLFKKKKFFYSRNLLLPLVVDNFYKICEFLNFFDVSAMDLKFEISFDSEFFGSVLYKQYKMKNFKDFFSSKVVCT